ncbi:hypothetical protein PoB_002734500 [Plakobranchus ocellatus]|uniref:Uncharacterized protein n=1 Tax=Plakobranchus ocellatus TaxID=259542 RepID=A0AAV4A1P9_9GAST|nr:hypothetical protein PoB_002734500 [Plakobranchus ocellatus]
MRREGWRTLTEPNRSRRTRIVTNRNLYVRAQLSRGTFKATCPRTTVTERDKEVGRKEGWGWRRLTEPDRSRRTRIVPNRRRGDKLYVRAQFVRRGSRKIGQPHQSRARNRANLPSKGGKGEQAPNLDQSRGTKHRILTNREAQSTES